MKKKGFGMGRWNGFGGKVKDEEDIETAMKRELQEEAGLIAGGFSERGIIEFRFTKRPEEVLEVHVFMVSDFTGDPKESEEMKPRWFFLDEIPFHEMWSDDPHWFPLFLKGIKFRGSFLFDDADLVLERDVKEVQSL